MAISTIAQGDTFDSWRIALNTTIGRWNALGESSAIVISGGTIDGTVLGGTTPAAGTFTNLAITGSFDASGGTITLGATTFADDSISGDKIQGGTIECNQMEISSAPTATNHATTKTYVDNIQSALSSSISTNTTNISSNTSSISSLNNNITNINNTITELQNEQVVLAIVLG
jgi:hypothetical protein